MARAARRPVAAVLVTALAVVLAGALAVAGPAAAAPADRYTVVGPGADGQPEHLFGIAAETLGDGRRYREILDLNRDRVQPDGTRMTDVMIRPGWILLLPADARGPRVTVGSPPTFAPAGITAAPDATGRPAPASPPSALPMRLGAGAGAVALVGLALLVLRAGRRRRPAPPDADPDVVPVEPATEDDSTPPPSPDAPLMSGDHAVPAPDADGTALDCAGDPALIRLIGARREPGHGWLAEGESPPDGPAVVVVGHGEPGDLWIDLSAAPDVLTVTGGAAARLRFAHALVARLAAAGAPPAVVGEALAEDLPDGCEHVATLDDLRPGGSRVVVYAVEPGDDPVRLPRDGVAAVLVGDVPPARWSLSLP